MAISGDGSILAVGALFHDDGDGDECQHGQVQVYQFANSRWDPLGQDLVGGTVQGCFGQSVTLSAEDGMILAIGVSAGNGSALARDETGNTYLPE